MTLPVDNDSEEKIYFTKKEIMKLFRVSIMTIDNWHRAGFIDKMDISYHKKIFTLPKIVRSTLKNLDSEKQNLINNINNNGIKELLESERFYTSGELVKMYNVTIQDVSKWRNFGLIEFVECPKCMYWHRLPNHLPNPQNLEKENENDDTTQK